MRQAMFVLAFVESPNKYTVPRSLQDFSRRSAPRRSWAAVSAPKKADRADRQPCSCPMRFGPADSEATRM